MGYPLSEIVDFLADMISEPPAYHDNPTIFGIAPLQQANHQHISFLADHKYRRDLSTTNAKAVLVSAENVAYCPKNCVVIVVKNPYLAYAKLTAKFAQKPKHQSPFIHPTAIIADSVKLGNNVCIGAYCVLGDHVEIGDDSCLESHVCLQDGVKIGRHAWLKPHVFIGNDCQIGDFVHIHSHASIGNEGFGFAPTADIINQGWQKIHQLGRVVIGNHVRIGSQTCIDRGALTDTVIGDHVIIDNLVQIAHNVEIGSGTAIAGCVGIAGSAKIGKGCILAGGVGVVGHIEICDGVTITGMTMVTRSIHQAGSYSSGTPLLPSHLWQKLLVKMKRLIHE